MPISAGINELGTDADSPAGALDRAFKNVSDTECFADFPEVALDAVFVLHHGGAADDFEVGHFGEIGQDLVLNTIGEVGVLFVVTKIFKRENRDAFVGNCAGGVAKCFTGDRAVAKEDCETDRERTSGEKERRCQRPTRPARRRNRTDWPCFLPTLSALKFFRHLRITETIFAKINEMKSQTMFYFALAQIS